MENTLGKRIATLRKEKNLKQDDLAQKLNISPQAISKWENDLTCPDISILPELSSILGVSIDELLTGKKEETVKIVPAEERKEMSKMMLKIVVDSPKGDKVKINLPLSLIQAAIDMGISMPEISSNDSLKNIDLNKILELVKQGVIGNLMEVESAEGDIVKIFVE